VRGDSGQDPFPRTTKSGLFFFEKKGFRNYFTEEQMAQVRHPPQSGWLDEWGRLKGGRPFG